MDRQSQSDKIAAAAVALLLILTAWGNAVPMLVVASLGLAVTTVLMRRSVARDGALAVTVGLGLAVGLASVLLLR